MWWSLEDRKSAAAQVTADDSGHAGCLVSYLTKAARDILLQGTLKHSSEYAIKG